MVSPDYTDSLYGGIGIYVDLLINQILFYTTYDITLIICRYKDNTSTVLKHKVVCERFDYYSIPYRFGDSFSEFDVNGLSPNPLTPVRLCEFNTTVFKFIMEIVKDKKYDLIHVHDAYSAPAVFGVKHLLAIPLIATIHAMTENQMFLTSLRDFLIKNSDTLTTNSEKMKLRIISEFGVAKQIHVINPTININDYDYQEMEPLGVSGDPFIITYLGRLAKYKGIHIFLDSIAILNELFDYGAIHFNIIGTGKVDLDKIIAERKLVNVTVHGQLSNREALNILNSSYVQVVPSLNEPFGIVVLEGMSVGTCVIGSNSSFGELINDMVDGILFESNDPSDLAAKIQMAISDPFLRNTIAKNAHDKSQKNIEKFAIDHIKLYGAISTGLGKINN
jgi:glycosyltransferase involved in cell wall biosynthesis